MKHRRIVSWLNGFLAACMVLAALTFNTARAAPPMLASGSSTPGPGSEDGIRRDYHDQTGRLTFLGVDPGSRLDVAGASAQGLAEGGFAYLETYGPEFGLRQPSQELRALSSTVAAGGGKSSRYQQVYQGVPVVGGELIVNTAPSGGLHSISGETSPDLSLSTIPTVTAGVARQTALDAVAKWYGVKVEGLVAAEPELWIFDERLLLPSERPAELVWRTEVKSTSSEPIRELVLVSTTHGGISLHFNQVDTSWNRATIGNAAGPARSYQQETEAPTESLTWTPIAASTTAPPTETTIASETPVPTYTPEASAVASETSSETPPPTDAPTTTPTATATEGRPTEVQFFGGGIRDTYTANNNTGLPGTFLCDETDLECTGGADSHADAAHLHAANAFDFYDDFHGRNSLDNGGMTLVSTVHFGFFFENAFWDGSQMVYGDGAGFPLADDVVAHELTHGVTQFESNLFYYYQSGAINESFSDLWGEFIDQTNGSGNDSPAVKWQMGEDVTGLGTIRDMAFPTTYGDPDRMTSSLYYTGDGDNGGVHTNSGINNKAVYLMTDGGVFNNRGVTPLGLTKVAAIYYEAQTSLLTSGADYGDLYNALYQACLNRVGGPEGITASDCQEVRDATEAVEMNLQPVAGFNTDAPLCPSGQVPSNLFFDDLENGSANWSFGVLSGTSRWRYDSPYGPFAHSGSHFLYADDFPDDISDSYAAMNSSVTLPSGAYLHFAHAYGFEDFEGVYYDGGVLEYSTNGGASWADAGSLFDTNGYDGTIASGFANPLAGRLAFAADSHGYISSRLNLSSLAGQSVRFHWRMSTDDSVYDWGWFVDDVRIYTCVTATPGPTPTPTPAPVFGDVLDGHWAKEYIEALFNAGYVAGCSANPRLYCPNNTMNRAESAVFVERGIHGGGYLPPDPTTQVFNDVSLGQWYAKWANGLWEDGFTAGCSASPLLYCPLQGHSRAEATVFFLRMLNGAAYVPPSPTTLLFADVPLTEWYAKWVHAAYAAELVLPCSTSPGLRFCPNDPLTRDMAAYMMVQAKGGLPLPTPIPTPTPTP